MKPASLLSSGFLILAVALVGYGLFGLSHFEWYTGEFYDQHLVVFDNGVYPFMWGIALLLIGQIARLQHRFPATLLAAGAALLLLVWQRAMAPGAVAGREVFPDAGLLNELIIIAAVVLAIGLADRPIERLIRSALGRNR